MKKLRLGTRKSALALAQSTWVKDSLMALNPGLEIELVKISTEGDRVLDRFLSEIGGKGLFVKEIEEAMLAREIDLAVHSLKDLPSLIPEGLCIAAYPEREDHSDLLISKSGQDLLALPQAAVVGTSSERRRIQMARKRPDLEFKMLRGNIDTRVKKLITGDYDAIVLAAAGVKRLALEIPASTNLDIVPSVGQGTLALQCRLAKDQAADDDQETYQAIRKLNHELSEQAALIERGFQAKIGGDCNLPMGALATQIDTETDPGKWSLHIFMSNPQADKIVESTHECSVEDLLHFGERVAMTILGEGGKEIIDEWQSIHRGSGTG